MWVLSCVYTWPCHVDRRERLRGAEVTFGNDRTWRIIYIYTIYIYIRYKSSDYWKTDYYSLLFVVCYILVILINLFSVGLKINFR